MERLLPQIPIPNELMWMIDGQDRKRATKLITDYVALCAEEQDKDLKNWVVRCRDDVLYPLAHQPTEIGRRAEILGSQTVALLTPNV